jgi:hypothetical protein
MAPSGALPALPENKTPLRGALSTRTRRHFFSYEVGDDQIKAMCNVSIREDKSCGQTEEEPLHQPCQADVRG